MTVFRENGGTIDFNPGVNWDGGWQSTQEYRTVINTSRDGSEQRSSLRSQPRYDCEYEAVLDGAARREFEAFLAFHQRKKVFAPDRTRFATVTVAASGTTMTVNEANDWIRPGRFVFLEWGVQWRRMEVLAVSGGLVTFTASVPETFPIGADVFPAVLGYVTPGLSSSLETDGVIQAKVQFEASPGEFAPRIAPAAPYQFNSREVFTMRPNWINPVKVDFDLDTETVDVGHGRVARFNPVDYTHRVVQATFLARDRDEVDYLLDLFHRHQAMRGEFYMPTWSDDLPPFSAITSGQPYLTTAGTLVADNYVGSPVHKAIAVRLRNGTSIYRKVSAIAEVSGNSRLTLTSNWGSTVQPKDILSISWLPVYRFASDRIVLRWITDSVAEAKVSFTALKDLTPEVMP